jgi:tetratricopeptide (TPR) repeat protein
VYAAACLSKENGIVLPLLIFAAELLGPGVGRQGSGTNLETGMRPLGTLTIVAIAYLLVRRVVVGSLAGDYPTFVFAHASATTRALTMLGAVPVVLRLLLWPTHIAVEYMPQAIRIYTHADARLLPCAMLIIGLIALVASPRRSGPVISWAIAWTGVALLPVSNLLIPSGVVLAPRTLFLPSVGVVIAIAGTLEVLARRATSRWPAMAAPRSRHIAVGFAFGLVCAGLAGSIERTLAWHDDLTLVFQTVLDAPRSYLARDAYGRALFELGHAAEGERELKRAIALYPEDPGPYAHLAAAYAAAGLCQPAIPLFRQALAILPTRPDARTGLARCLDASRIPAAEGHASP